MVVEDPARIRVRLVVALAAVVLAGACGPVTADDTDRSRIEVMASDPVFVHRAGELWRKEGFADTNHRYYSDNEVSGGVDLWPGEVAPAAPTPEEVRGQLPQLLAVLRDGGWIIHGASCELTVDESGGDPDQVSLRYAWAVDGHRIQDEVTYQVRVRASHDPWSGAAEPATVRMAAPFHADPDADRWFSPPPEPLGPGETCVERGDPWFDGDPTPREEEVVDGAYERPAVSPAPDPTPG